MGLVFLVRDDRTGRRYAAKTVKNFYLTRPRAMKRFEREARLWMELGNHPNIVQAHFLEWIDERPVLFLEYVDGGDLDGQLQDQPLSLRRSLRFMIQFCRGMVHARMCLPGFMHRDIKPSNCLLTSGDILKVTDFGLACILGDQDEEADEGAEPAPVSRPVQALEPGSATREGLVAGTLPYMSPEMFRKPPAVDARSDIYSFGVMFYRMVTAQRPLEASTYTDWAIQHTSVMPHPTTFHNARVPGALDALILSCLEKDSARRPGGFSVILQQLESILRERYDETVARPPDPRPSFDDLRRRGVSLESLGKASASADELEQPADLNAGYVPALLDCARIHEKSGRNAKALQDVETALTLDPRNVDALLFRGRLLALEGLLDEALECAEKAIGIDARCIPAWLHRSRILMDKNDLVHALSGYDRVCRMAPELASGWEGKGRVLIRMGTIQEGLKLVDRALRIDRNLPGGWRARAEALLAQGHPRRALRAVDRSISLDRKDADSWRVRSSILLEDGRVKDAIAAMERGLDCAPDDAMLWNQMGLLRMAAGMHSEAVADLDNAIARKPTEPILHVHRAHALLALGHEDHARAALETARRIEPGIRAHVIGFPELEALLD